MRSRRRIAMLAGAVVCSMFTMTWLPVTGAVFNDMQQAVGSINVGASESDPEVPAECEGMTFAETIVGTEGDDVIEGANGGALIVGLGGDDTIAGGNGKDCIVGGAGNDTISGDNGPDRLFGGPGDDVITGGHGPDDIDGGGDTDTCDGGSGPNVIVNCEGDGDSLFEAIPGVVVERPVRPGATATPDQGVGPTPDPAIGREKLLEPCPGGADCVIYVVRAGDNLVSIVRFFDVSLSDTVDLNPWINGASHLPIGVDLRLPWPDWLPGRPGAVPPDPTPSPSPEPTPGDPTPLPTPEPTPPPTPEPPPTDPPSDPPPPTPEPTQGEPSPP